MVLFLAHHTISIKWPIDKSPEPISEFCRLLYKYYPTTLVMIIYRPINEIVKLESLARHKVFSYHLIRRLIEGHIDTPYLLERLSICVSGNTRLRGKEITY